MRRHLPLILPFAAVTLAVGILVWQLVLTFGPEPEKSSRRVAEQPIDGIGESDVQANHLRRAVKSERNPNPDAVRSLTHPEPVRVEFAGVLKYGAPLHANGPGRMPAKEGERELGGDTLPSEPLAYARSLKGIDPPLLAWLQRWHAAVLADRSLPDKNDHPPLDTTRLAAHELYELGRGIRFIQGDEEGGLSFYRAAIKQATVNLRDPPSTTLTPQQVRDRDSLRMLARPLWTSGDYHAALNLFALLASAEPDGTFEQYRARYLEAEARLALVEESASYADEAAGVYADLLANPGYELSPALTGELHWALGSALYTKGDFSSSILHFREARLVKNQYYTKMAEDMEIHATALSGNLDAARALVTSAGDKLGDQREESLLEWIEGLTSTTLGYGVRR